MAESPRSGERYSRRLDDELARDPGDVDETADTQLWDTPGRDGVVSDADGDPDRTDLRSAIGAYASLVQFPTTARALISAAEDGDAPDEVLRALRGLDPDDTLANMVELWDVLGLGSGHRF